MAPNHTSDKAPVTVFVCNNCGRDGLDNSQESNGMGARLAAALATRLAGANGVRVQAVTCMGGCNHPCAIALSAPQKLTYMYGNLNDMPDTVAAIEKYVAQYRISESGMVPRADKPEIFANVLVRLPPPEWTSADGKVSAAAFDLVPGSGDLRRADEDA